MTAGAYGAAMSRIQFAACSCPEVLVNGDQFAVIRARPTYEDMLSQDTIPGGLPNPTEREVPREPKQHEPRDA